MRVGAGRLSLGLPRAKRPPTPCSSVRIDTSTGGSIEFKEKLKMMRNLIRLGLILMLPVYAMGCGSGEPEETGTHEHEDGSTHADHNEDHDVGEADEAGHDHDEDGDSH